MLAEEAEVMGTVPFPGSSAFYRSRKSSHQVITHEGLGPAFRLAPRVLDGGEP